MWTSRVSGCRQKEDLEKMPFSLDFPFSSTESWPQAAAFSRHRRRGLWSVQSRKKKNSVWFSSIHRNRNEELCFFSFLCKHKFEHLALKPRPNLKVDLKIFIYQGHHTVPKYGSYAGGTLKNNWCYFVSPPHAFKPSLILDAIFRLGLPLIWVVWNFLLRVLRLVAAVVAGWV